VQALSDMVRFIDDLRGIAPVHIILGNHDMNLKHSHRISALDMLDMMDVNSGAESGAAGERITDLHSVTPKKYPVKLYRGMQLVHLDGFPVLMSAYHENMTQELKQFIQSHQNSQASETIPIEDVILFAHMAVPGAVMSFMKDQNGTTFSRQYDEDVSRSKNESHSSNPVFARDLSKHNVLSAEEEAADEAQQERLDAGLQITRNTSTTTTALSNGNGSRKQVPKYLSSFMRVFSGHFHHHHNVTPTVTYCGAPMQHHFGDAGDSQRGMILYEPSLNHMRFLRNPEWDQFRLIRLNSADDEAKVLNSIESYRDKHVSIGNTFNTMDLNLERLNQALLHAGARSVRIQPVKLRPSDMAKYSSDNYLSITAPSLSQSSVSENIHTFHDVLAEYARENDLSEQLVQKGKELINKTLNTSSALENLHIGETFRGNLESIIIENFLSIQGEVEFPVSHMKKGVWYIQGDNGSGKSAIFEAVCWALFDKFLRSDMKVDYAINDKTLRNCRVRLRFSNGYEVERFRKYKSLGGNGVRVYKDGVYQEAMERGHIRDSQRQVENLIGIDYDTFTKSIILSDQAVVFLAQDARRRRDFIEQLLGMNVFDSFLETLKEQKKEMEQQRITIEAKISMLNEQKQEIDSQVAAEVNTQQMKQELREAKVLLDKHTVAVERFQQEEKNQVHENLSFMKQEWEEFQNFEQRIQFVTLQKENQEATEEMNRLDTIINSLQSEIAEEDKESYLVESKIQNYRKVLDHQVCVTCERKVDEEQAKSMQEKISESLLPKFKELSASLVEKRQKLSEIQNDKEHWNSVQRSVSMQVSRIAGAMNIGSHEEISVPKEKPDWNYNESFEKIQESELNEMQLKEMQLLSEQTKIREKLKSLRYLIEENERRNTEQKQRLEQQITAYRNELVAVTDVKPLLQFWEQAFSPKPRKGFSSMRGYMMNRSVQDLNRILKYYSKMLTVSYDNTSKPDLIISFDAEFQVNEEYGKRSAGQRKRNQLVIFFSLFELVRQRSRFKSNFLMLDEIFDALDHNGQEDVQLCIRMLCNQPGLDRIFVITHSPEALENVADDFVIDVKSTPAGSDYMFEVDERVVEQV